MTANDPTGEFHPGDVNEGPPQRIAGSTLPATDETAEAVAGRGARHIEMDGDAR
jgi:hypothetical protein